MKTVSLNLAASAPTGISSFQDGDIFRESNIDLQAASLADALGWLKAQALAAGYLANDQTWTGSNEFDTGTGGGAKTISVTGDGDFVLENGGGLRVGTGAPDGGSWVASAFTTNQDCDAEFGGVLSFLARLVASQDTVGDAPSTLSHLLIHRVPQLTANRVYTLPSGAAGQLSLIKRTRTADAFTVTLADGGGNIGVISASNAGWMLAMCTGGTSWVPIAWGGTLSTVGTGT